MSETFEKILVKDDRLGYITQQVKYQVFKGGQNITCKAYTVISPCKFGKWCSVRPLTLDTSPLRRYIPGDRLSLESSQTSLTLYILERHFLTCCIKVFSLENNSFTLVAHPGWSSNGWILPKVSSNTRWCRFCSDSRMSACLWGDTLVRGCREP